MKTDSLFSIITNKNFLTKNIKNFIKNHTSLVIFLIYCVLAIIITSPVIFQITSHIPGYGDAFQVYSHIFKEYKNLEADGFLQYLSPFKLLKVDTWLLFFNKVFSPPIGYNIIWLFSFAFSSFAAYLIVKYFTKNNLAAFLAGLLYGFSPYHFAHSGQYAAKHIEFVAFFAYFLLKYFQRPSLKNLSFSILFLAIISLNEPHYTFYCLIFTFLVLVFHVIKKPEIFKNKKFIKLSSISIIACLVFLAWNYLPMIKVGVSEQNYLNPTINLSEFYSADLLGIITPSWLHPIWGDSFKAVRSKFSGYPVEVTIYAGIITIFFSIYALFNRKNNKYIILFAVSAFLFFIFSLGPFLHILGPVKPKIPMPYLLLYKFIPFADNIRSTARIFVVSMLSFSVLAGFGLKYFLEKFKNLKLLLALFVFLFIILDFWTIPITTAIKINPFYQNLIEDQEPYSILQIPNSTSYVFSSRARYYNSLHNKNVIGGYDFARKIPGRYDFEKSTSIINKIIYGFPSGNINKDELIDTDDKNINTSILNYHNIKYIIIHKNYIGNELEQININNFEDLRKFVERKINTSIEYEDEEIISFKVEDPDKPRETILSITDISKENIEISDDIQSEKRHINLNIINTSNKIQKIKLNFDAQSPSNSAEINFYKNSTIINKNIIGPKKQNFEYYLNDIYPGNNIYKVEINENNKIDQKNTQNRDINTYINNITWEEIENINVPEFYNNLNTEIKDGSLIQFPIVTNYNFNNELNRFKNINILSYNDLLPNSNKLEDGLNITSSYSDLSNAYRHIPFFKQLFFDDPENINNKDVYLSENYKNYINLVLNKYKVNYIILHKDKINENDYYNINQFIENNINNFSIKYNTKDLTAFEINNSKTNTNEEILIFPNTGWGTVGASNEKYPQRTLHNPTTFKLLNFKNKKNNYEISFEAWSAIKNKKLFIELYLNNNKIRHYSLKNKHKRIIIETKNIAPSSSNEIAIKIYDSENNPLDADKQAIKISKFNVKRIK